MPETKFGIIILAAGASRRMKTAKQMLEYRGRSLIKHAAETAIGSICRPITVVLGERAKEIEAEIVDLPVTIVVNHRSAGGLGTSIGAGVKSATALSKELEAVIIMLCDQPLVSSEQINSLVETYERSGGSIVASSYADTIGVPALFGREHFIELAELGEDEGAKSVIKKHLDGVRLVPCREAAVDIDTPEDYRRLVER